jgi:RNA polymerase sigma factor (sigma-70 family)
MTYDYNKKLYEDYKKIKDKVERGMLPLVARNPAIDRATTDYAIAHADHYHADKDAGKNPPVPLKNAALLDRFSDLVMWEELKWSHPDKMSIVEYPVMSETQKEVRNEKQTLCDDILYGDRRYTGRRKTHFTDEDGALQVRNTRMAIPSDVGKYIDLYDALENAGLTDRQRQAIDLVFFENLTQEEAAAEMGVNKSNVNAYLSAAYRKLREYLTKE